MDTIDKFLSDKYKLNKYQDLKKLNGVKFNERMKLEFALRDPKNIEACDYLTIIYNKKKKNNKLSDNQSFHELFKEAQNINFFSLNILNIEFYKHELISADLFEIFEYLIKTNSENNKQNIPNYKYRKVNDTTTEVVYNDYEHYFYTNKTIDKYDIQNTYFYDTLPYYEENFSNEKDLITKINQSPEKYYQKTEIQLKSNLIFDNNVNLKINLAMPEKELTEYIKKLSKLYKNGKITKKMTTERKYKTIFKEIGEKYVTDPKEFQKLLFVYDMHHTPEVNNNVTKLFEELSKLLKISAETSETSNEQKDNMLGLAEGTLADLSGKFKKVLDNQLYLQL
ncbi:hypothetical protein AF78_04305 [Aliarcobacter butzleri L353]|uniref:hypothetical protein n=1 Tax=Aliarcobacter butzleri TaxID=28197 RepID=UPI000658B686|nr:hypothetical protein [Aliarcobacter butzleri]KLE05992.1 hypothetical protein AF78_04305 [Aliarcobacter butzleri L353]